MREQFGHNLVSSFYLWMEDRLAVDGEAVITGKTQTFRYARGLNTPSNLNAFYTSEKQFYADHDLSPSGVFITGVFHPQATSGTVVIIDHNEGRILLDQSFGTGITPSGQFVQKEINIYLTNETEEEILTRGEFYIATGQGSISENLNQIAKSKYKLPCIFIGSNFVKNKGFALGGVKETKTVIKGIVFARSNYQLDATISLFADAKERYFKVIDSEDFPYGEYWHVKSFPYSYTGLAGEVDGAFIEDVGGYKLKDSAQAKISKSILIGGLDFSISSIRETI